LDSRSPALWQRLDWLAAVALVAAVAVYAILFVDFNVPPFEDAAMLMRYAQHLAAGQGIVWNVGGPPVDGATDFLFMTAVAGLIRLGVAIGRSVRLLGLGAHVLTVLLVYWVNRRLWRGGLFISLATALYLAVGTGAWYVAAFFGTPAFALLAALTWALALLIMQSETPSPGLAVLFSLAALLTGLTRPEGVGLAAAMLIGILLYKGWTQSRRVVATFAVVFLVLGGAYFLWHWQYFGYPLPNPYYKKGGGLLHWDSFWESLGNLIRFAGPFTIAFVLGLRSPRTRRLAFAFVVPLLLFAASFILVSNETNFGGRFQYALWPLALMCYYPLVRGLDKELGLSWERARSFMGRLAWTSAALLALYALLRYSAQQSCVLTISSKSCGVAYEADGRYDLAKMLSTYQGKGYVIATSEAGLLPFYSNWDAVDTWGLNDSWIAHHGDITDAYLDAYRPELIVFHAYFSPLVPPRLNDKNLTQDWFRMTITLMNYAESRGYRLAAAFGDSPYEAHYYYVRADFPDSDRIFHQISTMKSYFWYATGRKAINYADIHS
jgi:arabinofuranosyltransferase